MKKLICTIMAAALVCISAAENSKDVKMSAELDFVHDVTTEKKPWTHLNFKENGSDDFNFAIIGDRSGRPIGNIFERCLEKINAMGPDFIMSVGDFINGYNVEDQSEPFLRKQWDVVENILKTSRAPFFRVVGNHDIAPDTSMFPGSHELQENLWIKQFGTPYYSFVRKNILFLCLESTDVPDGIGDKQLRWAIDTLKKHQDVRWTMIFMHNPGTWHQKNFQKLEEELYSRNYTVFAGDYHQYTRYNRNGRHYYMLGPSGGGWDTAYKVESRGKMFGDFHHITWVSIQDGIPHITLVDIEGIYDGDCVTTEKITWLTAKYFRGNKKLTPEQLAELKAKGLEVTDKE